MTTNGSRYVRSAIGSTQPFPEAVEDAEAHQREVGARVRIRRRQLNMSPPEFARRLGVTVTTIERWEGGKTSGVVLNAQQIAEVLNTSKGLLLGNESNGVERELAALRVQATRIADALERIADSQPQLDT